MKITKYSQRAHRKARVKGKLDTKKPRLVVYRSLDYNYAQLIDDLKHITLASASDLKITKGNKIEKAKHVGIELAKQALSKNINECIFDRNGYKYHGRIKAIAEGARESGLKF